MSPEHNEGPFGSWRHVFKLDPDRTITDEVLEAVCLSGTDAVLVGGTTGVTYDNTVDLLSRIRRFEVPCALEASSTEAAVPGFDWYLIPMVLNAASAEWVAGRQAEAIAQYGSFMPWDATWAEGYVILNDGAEAARLTGARTELTEAEAVAYARLADRLMRLPVVYCEYSGRFGDMRLVRRMREALTQARLFYGGGVADAGQARLAAEAAHTVVVGNAVYDHPAGALATVTAVKQTALL
ncbi:heptaprenylglyceryl phosphate synthase [Paenibacillus darwinianus]|uniref:Heptaprenylglyceryl phosphate synthase n=1 Tax=Paenibacillus darwinianus TaxID=1380763 RepID=A0A9W5S1B2_9BACL|nr:heptaprenylglyceryl phosphate synthase [Paenibacillus darwinianus]EXX88318.1 heptaprenylglyceryl phosphate synthase [Paenibacillus darwinianus]EXX89060.1 heptaprenylglyceryl phosphate synthase [Paenibacillus darwinianus]EXX89338.1 heptaprenylglyceryl phosphate synthase [Paenibacillus darwinianus]